MGQALPLADVSGGDIPPDVTPDVTPDQAVAAPLTDQLAHAQAQLAQAQLAQTREIDATGGRITLSWRGVTWTVAHEPDDGSGQRLTLSAELGSLYFTAEQFNHRFEAIDFIVRFNAISPDQLRLGPGGAISYRSTTRIGPADGTMAGTTGNTTLAGTLAVLLLEADLRVGQLAALLRPN